MNDLFFQLIQIAVGTRKELSRRPDLEEWVELYDIAQKQAVVGICFAAIQKICNSEIEEFYGMTDVLFYDWAGMATQIMLQNEDVNKKCVKLQQHLLNDGFKTYILKGQGVAKFYGKGKDEDNNLQGFRQCGDIDIWTMPNDVVKDERVSLSLSERRKLISNYCKKSLSAYNHKKEGYMHTSFPFFSNTEVEMHFTPSSMANPIKNKKLQIWFEKQWVDLSVTQIEKEGIYMPSMKFNLVYLVLHIFKHMIYEGIGMRQIIDYYFVLKHSLKQDREYAFKILSEFDLEGFTGALMFVMEKVFNDSCLTEEEMLCKPDVSRGKMLLDIIEEGGNFGHYSKFVINNRNNTIINRMKRFLERNAYLFKYYHDEIIWHFINKIIFIKS